MSLKMIASTVIAALLFTVTGISVSQADYPTMPPTHIAIDSSYGGMGTVFPRAGDVAQPLNMMPLFKQYAMVEFDFNNRNSFKGRNNQLSIPSFGGWNNSYYTPTIYIKCYGGGIEVVIGRADSGHANAYVAQCNGKVKKFDAYTFWLRLANDSYPNVHPWIELAGNGTNVALTLEK